jgi:hypothetical protein
MFSGLGTWLKKLTHFHDWKFLTDVNRNNYRVCSICKQKQIKISGIAGESAIWFRVEN